MTRRLTQEDSIDSGKMTEAIRLKPGSAALTLQIEDRLGVCLIELPLVFVADGETIGD